MKSDFLIALTQLAAERNLPKEIVLSAIEAALVSAYRKESLSAGQNISVKLDPGSGDVSVYLLKTVVETVADPQLELTVEDAKKIKLDAKVGDSVPTETLPHSAGRIAAQTAKQVVLQRLREAERELVYEEYAHKEGEVFTVTIQRIEPKQITVELGRAAAILPSSEQVYFERYRVGQKIKVLLQSVRKSTKGPELIVSRADKQLLKRLFEMEVPEIYNGAVEIKAIAREPGARSKVAVWARQEGVDPVGSCVGLRGIRIQNIVNELHGEKIDVVAWDKEAAIFVAHALSPAQVLRVDLNHETGTAIAIVPDRQLSLAIGKEGQNARLGAKLTGWKVDIKSDIEATAAQPAKAPPKEAAAVAERPAEAKPAKAHAKAPVEAAAQQEPLAPAAELETAPAATTEAPTEAAPAEEQKPVEALDEDLLKLLEDEEGQPAEQEGEPVPAQDLSASLNELPPDIWSVRRAGAAPEPGRIRFAEDIVELRDSGRRKRGEEPSKAGKRKSKTGKWR
jgi:N utilization substance protein A